MTTEPADAPITLTVEQIVAGLTAERDRQLAKIGEGQSSRNAANAKIREARARLADVDRLLAATKPRKKSATAASS